MSILEAVLMPRTSLLLRVAPITALCCLGALSGCSAGKLDIPQQVFRGQSLCLQDWMVLGPFDAPEGVAGLETAIVPNERNEALPPEDFLKFTGSIETSANDGFVNHIKGRRIVAVSCSIVIAAVVGSHTAEASGILVEGKLRARAFNPTKATEYAFMRANSSFRALLVGTTYDIEITNNDVKLWTVRFVYDGSNALITAPADGDYYRTRTPSGKEFSAILSKEPVPALNIHDVFGLSVLWTVLCYPTHVAAGQLQNHSEIPLLWMIPRRSAVAYGYRWDADLADDYNAKSIQILRSSALDLDLVGEAMRPNLIIRDTVAAKNELTLALNVRRQQSDGFSVADLRISDWESVGGRRMPKNAQLQLALGESQTHKHFWRMYAFEIDRVSPAPDATVSLPQIAGVTHVEDFRFAEKRGDHVYKASTYDLSPGASWPAHYDSQQLALREGYFKSIVRPSYWAAGHAAVWAALGDDYRCLYRGMA